MAQLHDLTAIQQRDALRSGEVSPLHLTAHYLARIARLDGQIGSFVEITADAAMARAERLTIEATSETRNGQLWGMPFADKDLVTRAGVPTRYGSQLHRDFVPDTTADQAAVLDEAGGISLGKTATPEFGLTGYTETLIGPPTRDPWHSANGAGGSSGGAAAAVAAGLLPLAPASDGGGSIRIPAATVGVVGIKPSRGRIPFATGLESPAGLSVSGPIARTVEDAAMLLDVQIAGRPYPYATRAMGEGPFLDAAGRPPASAHIGVTTVSPWDDADDIRLDSDAARAVDIAATLLAEAGYGVDQFAWRPRGYPEMFTTLWRTSAARMNLSDAELELVAPITAWLVREGRTLSGAQVLDALTAASAFERATITAFAPFDAVLTPALALPPRPIGWFDQADAARNFSQQVQYAPYSSFVNVAGLPAIVLPVTTDDAGHPVSVQLIGRPGGEAAIIAVAAQLERLAMRMPKPPLWNR
ncbi:Aspartyl-tRNA(Asn) amidotransferase subunit A amidotransferase subunit A [Microbacterium esteraromaticum]|uniref:Aspartyl-tRNA(Asn) amidotransferase subunit A amidotransferase subunit A n=1 Tax=Microbacterium esteraromaticum TaxID=57043 RepID=A0A1R4J916_9MICO|nr:amidase [Microbacterium esteraromaticum]SJN28522.1 Aspartyl-tRNA(Asn) amidotransferase subunit A amidotransferase subunit A [Microbacterium esteraromaticum]